MKRTFVIAALGGLLALGALAYRIALTATPRPPAQRLRLAADVSLQTPPAPPGSDLARLRERLGGLEPPALPETPSAQVRSEVLAYCQEAVRAGDTLGALQLLQRLRSQQTAPDPAVEELTGRCQMALDLYEDALATFRRLARQPGEGAVQPWILASRALAALEREDEALKELEAASVRCGEAPVEARLSLAAEFEQLGALVRALELVRLVQRDHPGDLRPQTAAGRLLFKLQRMEEARSELQSVLRTASDDRTARYYLAMVSNNPLTRERDAGLTEDLLLRNVQQDPTDRASLQRLGELYQEQERYREAAHVYTQLLEVEPDLASGRSQLARAYARLGEQAQSAGQQEIAQRFIQRDRDEDRLTAACRRERKNAGNWLKLARLYQEGGQHRKALRVLQAAYCANPGSPEVRNALRALYGKLDLPGPEPTGAG